jgi:hypothetical protein
MKLHRPYIPLSVRVKVAERQVKALHEPPARMGLADGARLFQLLWVLFGDQKYQLDHNPALALRRRRGTGKDTVYSPAANNPDFLEYRLDDGHLQKTTGRAPGAERTVTSKGSDRWLIAKFNKLEGRTKRRPQTSWPKGRKMRSKPFPKRKSHLGKK